MNAQTAITSELTTFAHAAVSAAMGQGLAMDMLREAAQEAVLTSISDPSRSALDRFDDIGRACAADVNERFGFGLKSPTLSAVCEYTKGRDGKPARGQCALQNGQRIGNPAHKIAAYMTALRPYVKAGDLQSIASMTTAKATKGDKPTEPKPPKDKVKTSKSAPLTADDAIAALQAFHKAGTLAPAQYAALQAFVTPPAELALPLAQRIDAPALALQH